MISMDCCYSTTQDSSRWNLYKERLKQRWSLLQDQEIDLCRGKYDHLARVINKKFKEPYAHARDFVDRLWFEVFLSRY